MASARVLAHPHPTRRFVDLVALAERRLADAFGGRIARLYGFGIALSYAFALFLLNTRAEAILAQALTALAWIPAGLVALGAARDRAELDELGMVALVRQRGFDAQSLELARFFAAVTRIARVTGYPALLLVLARAALARDGAAALASAHAALGALVYVLCLSFLLGALARASAVLSGGRGRLLLVALVLVPHLATTLFPGMPSVPRLLGGVLELFFGGGA
ncbi:MAG TPA: hypothetical protein VMS65_03710 [Polyangiaceae bacterium]|nr:hypothetical protein [Polyangiaceae bacterium]